MKSKHLGQTLLITGGTGSLGQALVARLIAEDNHFDKIIVYSRDERKQEDMWEKFRSWPKAHKLRFLVGDIRDKERLRTALREVTQVIHTAALKIVPTLEYNPEEAVKTNILGTQNLIQLAHESPIMERVVAVSTDKAVSPTNLYGATKLAMEKLTIAANNFNKEYGPRFSVVRYGNVSGSRGSVIPLFQRLLAQRKGLTITDDRCTRFWITLQDARDFVLMALSVMEGGEIFIPDMKSYKITDLAEVMLEADDRNFNSARYTLGPAKIIGLRPGEKLHEELVSIHEMSYLRDQDHYFVIGDQIQEDYVKLIKEEQLPEQSYNSSQSVMSKQELNKLMLDNKFIFDFTSAGTIEQTQDIQVWG